MKYKGIFFDIGWTLMKPQRSWFFSDLFYSFVGDGQLSQERLDWAAEKAMPILDNDHRMDTLEQEEQQFRKFYCSVLTNLPAVGLGAECANMLAHDKVYNFRNYVFFEDVKPVLERLRGSYRLGVISDTWPSSEYFLKEHEIYDLFDSITFSCQLGVFKPDPQMYQHALQSIGLPAEQTIFVDDSLSCLRGAADKGITPIQMRKKEGLAQDSTILSVGSMTELEHILHIM